MLTTHAVISIFLLLENAIVEAAQFIKLDWAQRWKKHLHICFCAHKRGSFKMDDLFSF